MGPFLRPLGAPFARSVHAPSMTERAIRLIRSAEDRCEARRIPPIYLDIEGTDRAAGGRTPEQR
jgi:hypothetical protein